MAGVDAPPIYGPADHVINHVAPAVEGKAPCGFLRDTASNAALGPWVKDSVDIVSPTCGTVRISVSGRAVEHYAAMALMKRSPNRTANWALVMDRSRDGILDSFFERFRIR